MLVSAAGAFLCGALQCATCQLRCPASLHTKANPNTNTNVKRITNTNINIDQWCLLTCHNRVVLHHCLSEYNAISLSASTKEYARNAILDVPTFNSTLLTTIQHHLHLNIGWKRIGNRCKGNARDM